MFRRVNLKDEFRKITGVCDSIHRSFTIDLQIIPSASGFVTDECKTQIRELNWMELKVGGRFDFMEIRLKES